MEEKKDSKQKSRVEEIKDGIKEDFPDSNLRIQEKLCDEDEINYFFSHEEIRLRDSSQREMGTVISHISFRFQDLLETFYNILADGNPENQTALQLLISMRTLETLNKEISQDTTL